MTISITMENKDSVTVKILKCLAATAFWILIWETASLLLGEHLKMFLPSPFKVIKKLFILLAEKDFLAAVGMTLLRIAAGFISGAAVGIVLGIVTNLSSVAKTLISPLLKVIRAVPVVSFIILAFLFISVDSLPIFISFLMVVPLVWLSCHDALDGSD